MKNQLFIPDKLKVGFQTRSDTYTQKLAYVIYFDKKGVLRKETSWQSWRDKKVSPVEYDNVPTEGFVLNKGVGGARYSDWNARNEYIRVYDPRDFEFEISVANLLFILRDCACSPGKGLEGKFVYAWDKNNLVLLPAVSQEFAASKGFTDLQDKKVSKKDLIHGATYLTKNQQELMYVGKFNYYYMVSPKYNRGQYVLNEKDKGVVLVHAFWDGTKFKYMQDTKNIAVLKSEVVSPEYSSLVSRYNKTIHAKRPVGLKLREKKLDLIANKKDGIFFKEKDGNFVQYYYRYNDNSIHDEKIFSFKNGAVRYDYNNTVYAYGPKDGRKCYDNYYWDRIKLKTVPWIEPENNELVIVFDDGSESSMYQVANANNGYSDERFGKQL